MPRSSSSSRSYSSPSSSSRTSSSYSHSSNTNTVKPSAVPPASKPVESNHSTLLQAQSNPVQQIQVQTSQPSFMSTVFQGMAWGMGSTIGRRMFEPRVNPEPHSSSTQSNQSQINQSQSNPTPTIETPNSYVLDSNEMFKKYQECMERKDTDVSCEMLLNNGSK